MSKVANSQSKRAKKARKRPAKTAKKEQAKPVQPASWSMSPEDALRIDYLVEEVSFNDDA